MALIKFCLRVGISRVVKCTYCLNINTNMYEFQDVYNLREKVEKKTSNSLTTTNKFLNKVWLLSFF